MLAILTLTTLTIPASATSVTKDGASLIDAHEDKMRQAGYEYAVKNNLLLTEDEANQYKEELGSNKSIDANLKKKAISANTIFQNNPNLKSEADDLLRQFPEQSASISGGSVTSPKEITSSTATSDSQAQSNSSLVDPSGYGVSWEYIYSEMTTYDTKTASNWSTLQQVVVNLAQLGAKGASGIVVAILSGVLGSSSLPTSCTNYQMVSKTHWCSTLKHGQLYVDGGLVNGMIWHDYAITYRYDYYDEMYVSAWYNNQYYSNTKSAYVEASKNAYYDDDNYLQQTAFNQYYLYQNNYSVLYGYMSIPAVLLSSQDIFWYNSASNPFA